jgi:hypothetical protein
MFCVNCGKEIPEGVKFCPHCGTAISFHLQPDDKKNNEPITIEIVRKGMSESKAKKIVITILKEIGILALFVATSFIVKFAVFKILDSIPYPEVTQQQQEKFNTEYARREKECPYHVAFGDIAIELGWMEYKYDEDVTDSYSLMHLNEFRKSRREAHAEDTSEIVFWVFLIALPVIRYIIMLVKWLRKDNT